MLAEGFQMKILRQDAIKRGSSERQLASNRTPFSGEKEMMTILLKRREYLRATYLCTSQIEASTSLGKLPGYLNF